MPKQIKSPGFAPGEKTNSVLAICAMFSAFALGSALVSLLRSIDENGSTLSGLLGLICFAAYALFFALTAAHCIHGIMMYGRHENYGMLFCSMLSGVSAFTALINIQFALSMLFSSIGESELASSVIGDRSFDQFMADQRSSWMLMTLGVGLALLGGIIAVIRSMGKK